MFKKIIKLECLKPRDSIIDDMRIRVKFFGFTIYDRWFNRSCNGCWYDYKEREWETTIPSPPDYKQIRSWTNNFVGDTKTYLEEEKRLTELHLQYIKDYLKD